MKNCTPQNAPSRKFLYLQFFATALGLLTTAQVTVARVTLDDDNASRPVYENGIYDFDNGSTNGSNLGFGAWVFGRYAAGNFDTASGRSNGGTGTIDVSGKSFRLFDHNNSAAFIDVFRFFDEGTLGVGQTFSFDLDVNLRDGFKGFRLRDADDDTTIFQFEITNQGSNPGYTVSQAATGSGNVDPVYSDNTLFSFEFTQTTATGGVWEITRSGGVSGDYSGAYLGQISSFQLYTYMAGADPANAILFNKFKVTPAHE